MEKKVKATCSCCGQQVTVEHKPAKWEGQKDRVVIEHQKWQEG